MRCLQCGRELALLKKFTDGEFCSPDHRTEFYDNQQRLIIERLKQNADRLRAHRERLARKNAAPPVAPFLCPPVEIPVSHPGYLRRLELEPPELVLSPPGLQQEDFRSLRKQLGSLGYLADFPLPIFSSRSYVASRIEFLPVSQPKPSLRSFSHRATQGRISVAAPVGLRPDGLDRQHLQATEAARLAAGAFSSPPHVPFSGAKVDPTAVGSSRRMVGIPGPDPRRDSPALHGDPSPAIAGGPSEIPPADYSTATGLVALDRMFRFRPKAGVVDAALSNSEAIEAAPHDLRSEPICPVFTSEATTLEPASTGRMLGLPLNSAVADTSVPTLHALSAEMEAGPEEIAPPSRRIARQRLAPLPLERPLTAQAGGAVLDEALAAMERTVHGNLPVQQGPENPAFHSPASELAPRTLERLFRAAPRKGVADQNLAAAHSLEPVAEASPVAHVHPPSPAQDVNECAPRLSQRLYHMRPRAGVQDPQLSHRHQIPATQAEWLQSAAICTLPAAELKEYVLTAAASLVRFRAGAPVLSAEANDLAGAGLEASQFSGFTQHGTLPGDVLGGCIPRLQDRLYRMRPRTGVADPEMATFDRVASTSVAFSGTLAHGSLPAPAIKPLVPLEAGTPIRMRPRGPVGDHSTADLGHAGVSSATYVPEPQHGTLPTDILGECAPNWLDRLFRMRPRTGVHDADLAAFRSLIPADEAFASQTARGALPPMLADCAPNRIERLFRMRPRAGVHDLHLPELTLIAPAAASFIGIPDFAALPAPEAGEYSPRTAENPIRMRARGPVASQSVADLVDEGTVAAPFTSAPAHGALPADILGECAPNTVERPFRMRPRAGVAPHDLPAFEHLTTGDTETLLSAPRKSGLPMSEPEAIDPQVAQKLHALRVDGPVSSEALAALMQGAGSGFAWNTPSAALGRLPRQEFADHVPPMRQRPFVMRPRGPVAGHSVQAWLPIEEGEVAMFAGQVIPAVAGLAPVASYEPAFRDRLFVMRPRGPVAGKSAASFERVPAAGVELAAAAPLYPLSAPVDEPGYQPAFVDKLYRARPRAGVADKAIPVLWAIDVGAIELILPDVITPSMPPVLMRQAQMVFRERPIQMRPRGPKPGGTSTFEKIEPVNEDQKKVREASCMALPADAVGTAVLRFLGQPDPERPAVAVAGALALQIAVTDPLICEPTAICPENDLVGTRGMAPASEKLFRARPRQAKAMPFLVRREPVRLEESAEIALPSPQVLREFIELARHQAMPACTMLPGDDVLAVAPPVLHAELAFADCDLAVETPAFEPGLAGTIREAARAAYWNDLKHRWLGGLFEKWTTLPRDMVWIGASLTLLFGAFVHSQFIAGPHHSSTDDTVRADIGGNPLPPIESAVSKNWPTIQRNIANRAAIDLEDDFSTGLHRWEGERNWANTWSYDQLGGVRTGNLAVLRDSVDMTDYRLQFWGAIDKSSLGWVVRARDAKNYLAVRIVNSGSSRMPRFEVVRYAVIDGREREKTVTPIPFVTDPKTMWRVDMDVKGQFYTLMVQDHVVDFWQDSRFQSGSVGFFNPTGEHARLHRVRVTHRDDALGKVFALVAPEAGRKN